MTIDKQALREVAEEALPAMQRLLMMPNDELFDEALLNVDGDVDAANAFNLLSGPETMLALLDELEAETRYREGAFIACNRWHDKYREADDKLEAAERSIAELEAKLETADKLQDSAFRHGLQHGFSYGQTNDQAGFEQCMAAYSQKEKSNGC
ncbi:ead/Ea22-like family protein [Salmonella enterica]|nr:ead/Ea22-like family protein [Salmonella enterica subsp. enterica serovar Hvittingfoss]